MPAMDLQAVVAGTAAIGVLLLLAYLLYRFSRPQQRSQGSRALRWAADESRKELDGVARERDRLRDRSDWFRTLFEQTRDMVFAFGLEEDGLPGRFCEVNRTACRKLGYDQPRLLTMGPLDIELTEPASTSLGFTRAELVTLSDEEIRERARAVARRDAQVLMRQAAERGEVLYDRVFMTRGGDRIPVAVTARAFRRGERPMIMMTAVDTTERMKTEIALRESERRFREFFANSPIGVALYDAERNLINANLTCLRMFGVPDRNEFAAFNMFDNPYLPEEARDALGRGETVRCEMVVDFADLLRRTGFVTRRKDKAHLDMLIDNLGLDHEYNPRGYLAQVQDITRRREAEAALRQSERQLRQAQKMEAIGTLAGGIAHDFNNILTPILGYTEMSLSMGSPGPETREFMEEVLKAGGRAKELVNQILTFSRQTETEGQPVRITPIVKEVVKQQRAALPQNISVDITVKTERDLVSAEPTQLHQVVTNLCTNAAHAMRFSGGSLELRLSDFMLGKRSDSEFPHLAPGRYLRLSIKDGGCGMEQTTLDRIFEPFFTTKASGEGTGMGLAVVHGIVTSLKGTITVESEPGRGSTFHVILPVIEKLADRGTAATRPIPRGSECVLFVDDEVAILRMAARMLSSLGYRPVVANRGGDALSQFESNPETFDLVITDQVMPGMSGVELAQAVRAIRPELPVVLCTGFSEMYSREDAEAVGIRECILKPIAMRQLAETIRRVIDTAPEVAAATKTTAPAPPGA